MGRNNKGDEIRVDGNLRRVSLSGGIIQVPLINSTLVGCYMFTGKSLLPPWGHNDFSLK